MKTTLALIFALALAPQAKQDDGQKYASLIEPVKAGDEKALDEALRAIEGGLVKHKPTLAKLLDAIVLSGQKSALPRLRELLDKATETAFKLQLIGILGRMRDQRAQGVLIKLAEEKDEPAALAAIRLLIDLTGRAQIDFLKKLLTNESLARRLLAAEALLQMDVLEGYGPLRTEAEKGTTATKKDRVIPILRYVRRKETVDLLLQLMEDKDEKVATAARPVLIEVLTALHPYLRFDGSAPLEKIKAWWKENRPK